VNWVCTAITGLSLVFLLVFMTRRAEARRVRAPERADGAGAGAATAEQLPWYTRVGRYFSEGPFRNARFVFFIFMLLPVQTLFAHQWLTMPAYVLRAYSEAVANRMEWIVNWINPGIIFFGVPIITGADASRERLHADGRRVGRLGAADVPAGVRAEHDAVDHLPRAVLDRRGAVVAALSAIRGRAGAGGGRSRSTWGWPTCRG